MGTILLEKPLEAPDLPEGPYALEDRPGRTDARESKGIRQLVGQSIPRTEDTALLTGSARFIDDIRLQGMLYCKILRSTVAHAKLNAVDYSKALLLPGVHAAMCGRDIVGKVKPWGDAIPDLLVGDQFAFAVNKIVYEGQELAAVVADTKYQAWDGIEAIKVDCTPIPAQIDPEKSMLPGAPRIHEGVNYEFGEGNIFDRYRVRVGDVDQAEQDADIVMRQRFESNRQAGAALDPHGCVASYDSFTGILTLYSSTQTLFMLRDNLADALQLPRNRVRVIAPDVGAGFGSKAQLFAHEVIASLFSMQFGRPVHCVLGRGEIFVVGTARTAQVRHVALSMKKDGLITGYRDYLVHNCGAISMWGNQVVRIGTNVGMLPYAIENIRVDADCVHTNTVPGGALRGFGIPEMLWAKEQLVDMAAEALGLDPLDVRERNVVNPDIFPYRTPMGQVIDSTSILQCVRKAGEVIRWRERRAAKVPYEGVGMAIGMKYTSCRHPGFDTDLSAIRLRLETDGTVTIFSSDVNHGQSHATFLAQIVGDVMGVGFEKIALARPDTDSSPFGLGTYASRAAAVLGTACRNAAEKLRDRVFTIAAYVLQVDVDTLEAAHDQVYVRGVPGAGLYLENIASLAMYRTHQLPPGFESTLEVTSTYDTPTEREAPDGTGNLSVTYAGTAHAAHVRVDPTTGKITILEYCMVSDSGVVINPLVVEGQHQGGFLMGVGMAMGETYLYDDDGHLLNGSFKDYMAPTAPDLPELDQLYEIPAPSLTIPGGQKGVGESGTGPVPAVIGNAVANATGVRFTLLPITPDKMLLALREKERQGVATFRFPDDMPDFQGPRSHEDWPGPTGASDEESFFL
jgi:carbon-monoxide dehydrogenase large subunit